MQFDPATMRLLNEFTILEENDSDNRTHACVPQSLHMRLLNVRLVDNTEWQTDIKPDDCFVDGTTFEATSKRGYSYNQRIIGDVELEDFISVFDTSGALLKSYIPGDLISFTLDPDDEHAIGGRFNATSSDGIFFSGWSPKELPNDGLMVGEPGKLGFSNFDGNEPHLWFELEIYKDNFQKIFETIKNSCVPLAELRVAVTVQLFQDQIDAAIGYESPVQRYLYLEGTDSFSGWSRHRARLDSVTTYLGSSKKKHHSNHNTELENISSNQSKEVKLNGIQRIGVVTLVIYSVMVFLSNNLELNSTLFQSIAFGGLAIFVAVLVIDWIMKGFNSKQ